MLFGIFPHRVNIPAAGVLQTKNVVRMPRAYVLDCEPLIKHTLPVSYKHGILTELGTVTAAIWPWPRSKPDNRHPAMCEKAIEVPSGF